MSRELRFERWLGLALITAGVALFKLAPGVAQDAANVPVVYVAEIRGTINPASANYLETSIKFAEREKAEALIVELDTPGGLVSSAREMAQLIDRAQVPVVLYVTPAGASATSAGALLALASHVAAMAPGTAIGAAHPVDSSGKEIPGAMGEKVVNDTVAFAKGLAELRGRNTELAEKIVTKSRSLTVTEALKEKLVEIQAENRSTLIQSLDGRTVRLNKQETRKLRTANATVRESEMSWGQALLHRIADPNIAMILMTLGMLCLYAEITSPGLGFPGVIGVISILVSFITFQTLPIRTGGLILLLLGIAMLIGEAFAATGGILGLGGTVAFVLGVLWVMDPAQSGMGISPAVWIPSALAMGGGALFVAWAAGRTRRLAREALERMGGGTDLGLHGYRGRGEAVSADGLSGKAMIRGEIWDFQSDRPMRVGDSVVVDKVSGLRAHVKGV